jgi:hypothetical protein
MPPLPYSLDIIWLTFNEGVLNNNFELPSLTVSNYILTYLKDLSKSNVVHILIKATTSESIAKLAIRILLLLVGIDQRSPTFPHRFVFQTYFVGDIHCSDRDGIGQCRIADGFVPIRN